VLAIPLPGEPYLTPPAPHGGYLAALDDWPAGRPPRVGRYITPLLADLTPSPDVLAAWELASRLLADLGCEVVDVEPPFGPGADVAFQILWSVLAISPVPAAREPSLLPLTRWLREQGRATTSERLVNALADLQTRVRRHARSVSYDILLSPTLARAQAPVGFFRAAGSPERDFEEQARFSPYCAAYNLTGQPAVSLPLAMTDRDEPVGVMLAARPGADALLLAVAARLEQAAPWADRHPPLWSRPGAPIA
jgi:amidase